MRTINISEIEEARVKILDNASELIEEAELLFSNGKYARAYSLAHLACEEMAKIPMIVRAATETLRGKRFDWSKLNRRLKSHAEKIKGILLIDYILDPEIENDIDIKRFKESLKMIPFYNMLKNYSLYTSLIDDTFHKPSELISADLSMGLLKLAHKRFSFYQTVELYTRGKLEKVVKSPFFSEWGKQFINLFRRKRKGEKGNNA